MKRHLDDEGGEDAYLGTYEPASYDDYSPYDDDYLDCSEEVDD